MPPAVEVRDVSKRLGGRVAVDCVSFAVEPGSFFALLGPSGCGKTTTLRMIAGFEAPDAGEVRLGGERVDGLPPYRRDLNLVFQDYALFPHMSVAENVAFGLEMQGVAGAERMRRTGEALDLVRMGAYAARRPHELSGGQRQRVALARALARRPPVLLLDEPMGALDLALRKDMQAELKGLQRRLGTTFVHVTHDQEEALALADRVAVMDGGRVAQIGAPAELWNAPATAFVARFLGGANVLSAVATSADSVRAAGIEWRADRPHGRATGAAAALVVRPESLALRADEAGPFTIGDAAFAGATIRVSMLGPDGAVLAACVDAARAAEFAPGRRVSPSAAPAAVRIVDADDAETAR